MKKVTVLIAEGANSLEIPCRIFPNMKAAKQGCDKIFGMEGQDTKDGGYVYDIHLEDEERPHPISRELFTRFYYGCGGVYRLTLKEVDFDTRFIGWDLD